MDHLVKLQSSVNRSIYQPLANLQAFYDVMPDDYLCLATECSRQQKAMIVGEVDMALNAVVQLTNRLSAIRADLSDTESGHRVEVLGGQVTVDFESDRVDLSEEILSFVHQEGIDLQARLGLGK